MKTAATIHGYNTHRPEDKQAMLSDIGVASVDALFDAVPKSLRLVRPLNLPEALTEWQLERHMHDIAAKNATVKTHNSFLGGGAYDHYIPAVVDAIVNRGEFLTSYTPYQPEISQGLLQALHEYQQSLAVITGLPVVNGSCYDGATALADSAWACCLISGKHAQAELVVSAAIWPEYREVLDSYMDGRAVVRHTMPFDNKTGKIDVKKLDEMLAKIKPAGFLFQSPNAFGIVEDIEAIAKACARHGVISSCSFNPLAAGLFHSPGACGIDIVTCDGQPLGIPLSAGGPSLGVFATKREYRAYVPGRLIGKVTDINGNLAYALVYEDREQHVARERATSNICSNQALNALRAVMYLSSIGKHGLVKVATLNANKSHYLAEQLASIKGISLAFTGAFFNEFVIVLPKPAPEVLKQLEAKKIFGGIDYSGRFGLQHALLVCVTEKKTKADMDALASALREVLA
ncbi:MAG: aminomethyl-transferring glycine dehydrogenase subunit GcvPA [Alphaproteobacteria bacterium]